MANICANLRKIFPKLLLRPWRESFKMREMLRVPCVMLCPGLTELIESLPCSEKIPHFAKWWQGALSIPSHTAPAVVTSREHIWKSEPTSSCLAASSMCVAWPGYMNLAGWWPGWISSGSSLKSASGPCWHVLRDEGACSCSAGNWSSSTVLLIQKTEWDCSHVCGSQTELWHLGGITGFAWLGLCVLKHSAIGAALAFGWLESCLWKDQCLLFALFSFIWDICIAGDKAQLSKLRAGNWTGCGRKPYG